MKKIILASLFAGCVFAVVSSCTHETILPEQQITFSGDVGNILRAGCTFSGCHDTTNTGQARIDRYDDMMILGRVVAGKPHESELFKRITAYQSSEDRMPAAPYQPLSEDNIRKIYIWIAQGAQNN